MCIRDRTSFISNWHFPDSVYFFGVRAKQVSYWRDNSCRVRTQQKNSGDGVYRLGTIIQSILCTQSTWPFGNSLVRVGTQGIFRPCLKTIFCRAFSPDPTDCLWLSEDALSLDTKGVTWYISFLRALGEAKGEVSVTEEISRNKRLLLLN